MLRLLIMLEKRIFKIVTVYLSLSTTFLCSKRVIISVETVLFNSRDFTTLQNLFLHMFFSLRFLECSPFSFRESVTHKLLFDYYFYFSQFCLKKCISKFRSNIIVIDKTSFISKSDWLPRIYRFFFGTYWSILLPVEINFLKFASQLSSLDTTCSNSSLKLSLLNDL